MYPSPAVVTALSRTTGYTVATAPNVANTIAALRAKYGHENDTHGSVLTWLFDESGHLLPAAEVQRVKQANCMYFATHAFIGGAEWGFQSTYRFIEKESLGDKIAKGYLETYDGSWPQGSSAPDICLGVIYLHAAFMSRQPNNQAGFGDQDNPQGAKDWPAIGSHPVSSLMVYIYDAPLDYAASEASRAAVLAGGAQHEQQQQDAAKKNKPSL